MHFEPILTDLELFKGRIPEKSNIINRIRKILLIYEVQYTKFLI